MAAVERLLSLTPARRRRIVLRLDGGFGTDTTLNWALWQGYHVLAQGYSGKRAKAFARLVTCWQELRPGERGSAPAPVPLRYIDVLGPPW